MNVFRHAPEPPDAESMKTQPCRVCSRKVESVPKKGALDRAHLRMLATGAFSVPASDRYWRHKPWTSYR